MEKLRFESGRDTTDPDERILSDEDLDVLTEGGRHGVVRADTGHQV